MYAQFKSTGKKGDFNAYIVKSFRKQKGSKTSSVVVESLGKLSEIAQKYPDVDPRQWVIDYAAELTKKEKAEKEKVALKLSPTKRISSNSQRIVHGGDLLIQPFFYQLGLDSICEEITRRGRFEYDLTDIMKKLVFGRILFPDSKLGTWQRSQSFIEAPKFDLSDIYPALGTIAGESDYIQSQMYLNSLKTNKRDTSVIYYDCTNYYFEIEKADQDEVDENGKVTDKGLRKYGHSKENRPNPIVQLGMFMDSDGWPLAFCINPGNTPETQTLQPLEEKLANNFNLSEFVCCTDAGLGSRDNRKYNRTEMREYITVQSLKDKKIDPEVQEWALEDADWNIPGYMGKYTKAEAATLLADKFWDTTLYKNRWYKVGKEGFEEHYIVTYSQKYADYVRRTREEQIERAKKRIEKNEFKKSKSPNDCQRFIKEVNYSSNGEIADNKALEINEEKIKDEARFDGLYALATSLDDAPTAILKANSYRFEIEHLFRITKTDLSLRPIYLSRKDRIIGHFIICFIALLILKMLQRKMNEGLNKDDAFPIERIREQLSKIAYVCHDAVGYVPAFNRNNMTDRMQEALNIVIDNEIITKPRMRAILKEIKKR